MVAWIPIFLPAIMGMVPLSFLTATGLGVEASKLVLEWGGMGVLAAAFLFMLKWMMTRFEKSLETIEKRQDVTTKAIDVNTAAIIGIHQTLLAHDLTMVGIKPGDGEAMDEQAGTALKKYREVQSQLEVMKGALLKHSYEVTKHTVGG